MNKQQQRIDRIRSVYPEQLDHEDISWLTEKVEFLTDLLCYCPDCESAPCTMQCANITKAYNQGYMLGHNDTVEGVFQDIPSEDMDKRQDHHPEEPTP